MFHFRSSKMFVVVLLIMALRPQRMPSPPAIPSPPAMPVKEAPPSAGTLSPMSHTHTAQPTPP